MLTIDIAHCFSWLLGGHAMAKGSLEQGARTIMVYNQPPFGCYPSYISTLGLRNMSGPIDSDGCLIDVNVVVQATNVQFEAELRILHTKIPANTSIILVDLYSIINTLIQNGTQFGKNPKVLIVSN
jgi:hypothetical protein